MSLTARFHFWLIQTVVRFTRRAEFRDDLATALEANADPELRYLYFSDLAVAWLLATWILAMTVTLIAAGVQTLLGIRAGPTAAAALTAVLAFGLTGLIDAYWRLLLAWTANRRYRRSGWRIDRKSSRLMRLSLANDLPLLLQLLAAVFFTWKFP